MPPISRAHRIKEQGARIARAAAAALLLTCLAFQDADAGAETLFQKLSGDWTGWGWIELTSGDRERIRCQLAYELRGTGNETALSLRCAGASYNLDGSADFINEDGRISGSWQEKFYNAKGEVSGRATSNYMTLLLKGETVKAGLSLTSSDKCRHSMSISPNGVEFKKIIISLKRC